MGNKQHGLFQLKGGRIVLDSSANVEICIIPENERDNVLAALSSLNSQNPEEILWGIMYNAVADAISGEYSDQGIEAKSLDIIRQIVSRRMPCLNEEHLLLYTKMIHSVGDFSIAPFIRISEGFVHAFRTSVEDYLPIICDSTMTATGIYSKKIRQNSEVVSFLYDERTEKLALMEGITKSAASMRIACKEYPDGANFAVGNAPTALMELLKIGKNNPSIIRSVVGIPVGFVNASETKRKLHESSVEHITLLGNRGGSSITASVINGMGMILS